MSLITPNKNDYFEFVELSCGFTDLVKAYLQNHNGSLTIKQDINPGIPDSIIGHNVYKFLNHNISFNRAINKFYKTKFYQNYYQHYGSYFEKVMRVLLMDIFSLNAYGFLLQSTVKEVAEQEGCKFVDMVEVRKREEDFNLIQKMQSMIDSIALYRPGFDPSPLLRELDKAKTYVQEPTPYLLIEKQTKNFLERKFVHTLCYSYFTAFMEIKYSVITNLANILLTTISNDQIKQWIKGAKRELDIAKELDSSIFAI